MKNVEYLCDAIMSYTLYADPSSQQYHFRNPLGLKVFCGHALLFKDCPECKNHPPEMTKSYNGVTVPRLYDRETGLRIFGTHVQGYQASLYDLHLKCSGKSKSKVRDTSSIKELIRSYFLPDGTAACVARFLRKATGDDSITEDTPIYTFVESEKEVAHA
jgi:hypothetical protein